MKIPFCATLVRLLSFPFGPVPQVFGLLIAAVTPLVALQAQQTYATPYAFTTFAGLAGTTGSIDGTGSAARFNFPAGVAVDTAGTIYVADQASSTIRKITSTGVVTTLAGTAGGTGSTDDTGSAARFNSPWGVAVDALGTVYVADTGNSIIRKISSVGVVTTLAGTVGNPGWSNGTGSTAQFYVPRGVAVDAVGNVYVADTGNSTIRKITPAGVVTTLAGVGFSRGAIDGTGSAARFEWPTGVAVDGSGNVYVADQFNCTIRKITDAGVVTTLAGSAGTGGAIDGPGSIARFNSPQGVAVDGVGNIFVSVYSDSTIRKISPAGEVSSIGGTSGSPNGTTADGTGSAASFDGPTGVAVDGSGNIYVADLFNNTIRRGTLAPPALTSTASASGVLGQNFSYAATFSGEPTFSSASGLPRGLNFDVPTGVISGIPTEAGTSAVTLDATNSAGTGTTLLTLIIAKATGTVTLGDLNFTFNGSPVAATATTNPTVLAVTFTYNGSAIEPTDVGTYAVVGTINDPNYQGTVKGSLIIAKAAATVTLGNLSNAYDTMPHAATAITTPASLAVDFTYNGSPAAPINIGTYAVVGTINDANYHGNASGTLVVNKGVPRIYWIPPAAIFYGTALSSEQLNASASVAGTFAYSPASATVLSAGAQTLSATFTPLDGANYDEVSAQQTLVVNLASGGPLFVTQPTGRSVELGTGVTFAASAIGAPAPTYQWQKNGIDISGAVGGSYTIAGVVTDDAGSYRVVATNIAGSATSDVATLAIFVAPPSNAVVTITVE